MEKESKKQKFHRTGMVLTMENDGPPVFWPFEIGNYLVWGDATRDEFTGDFERVIEKKRGEYVLTQVVRLNRVIEGVKERDILDMDGINLCGRLLSDIGFAKEEETDNPFGYYHFHKNDNFIYIYPSKRGTVEIEGASDEGRVDGIIEYVHELQNILSLLFPSENFQQKFDAYFGYVEGSKYRTL